MVLLGLVQEVQEFQLRVSLPGHLQGAVPITSISPAYTAYLRYSQGYGPMDPDSGRKMNADLYP